MERGELQPVVGMKGVFHCQGDEPLFCKHHAGRAERKNPSIFKGRQEISRRPGPGVCRTIARTALQQATRRGTCEILVIKAALQIMQGGRLERDLTAIAVPRITRPSHPHAQDFRR
jgi:hypothetical protein